MTFFTAPIFPGNPRRSIWPLPRCRRPMAFYQPCGTFDGRRSDGLGLYEPRVQRRPACRTIPAFPYPASRQWDVMAEAWPARTGVCGIHPTGGAGPGVMQQQLVEKMGTGQDRRTAAALSRQDCSHRAGAQDYAVFQRSRTRGREPMSCAAPGGPRQTGHSVNSDLILGLTPPSPQLQY